MVCNFWSKFKKFQSETKLNLSWWKISALFPLRFSLSLIIFNLHRNRSHKTSLRRFQFWSYLLFCENETSPNISNIRRKILCTWETSSITTISKWFSSRNLIGPSSVALVRVTKTTSALFNMALVAALDLSRNSFRQNFRSSFIFLLLPPSFVVLNSV